MIATEKRPSVSRNSQWFESWFDSIHYHRLYGYRDDAEAARFVDALVTRLSPAPGAAALDLGCGAGRHSRQLAARGLRVTGMDLSAASIARAQRSPAPGLRFLRHDMREPFGIRRYDFVFNLFTSFGYFEDPADHERVVCNMARSLRPGRQLVLDYLNVRRAERQLIEHETREVEGVRYRITRWTDAGHFFKRIEIDDRTGERLEYVERVAKFRLADFCRMFPPNGLALEAVYGDYSLGEYDSSDSPRLILVARKSLGAGRQLREPRVSAPSGERLSFSGEILPDSAQGLW